MNETQLKFYYGHVRHEPWIDGGIVLSCKVPNGNKYHLRVPDWDWYMVRAAVQSLYTAFTREGGTL